MQELAQRLQEERTDHTALRKKYMANIKVDDVHVFYLVIEPLELSLTGPS